MSKQKPARIVPRLRFPEFEEDEEWKFREIREVGDIVTGKTPNTKDDSLWNGNILFITPTDIDEQVKYQISTQRKVVATKETKLLPSGSIVYTCIASIGKIAITKGKSISNQQINSIITNSKNNNEFIYYCLLHLTPWIKSIPAVSTLPIINKKGFSKIKIKITSNKKEQQKIAACLTALDDLISAVTGRLDALKRHKQGLMQQLFPAEGETVPRLRFAEFRDTGEWEVKEVGEIFTVTRGYVLSMNLVNDQISDATPYPVYSSQTKNNGLSGYYSEFLYEDAITWTTDGANAGDVNYRSGKFYCTNVCGVLINKEGYTNLCVASLIDRVAKNHVSYVGNPKLMNGIMSKIRIPVPSLVEQQKIAACLTALDDLIAAQTQKIAKLKTHKLGLMQQLFPAVGETHR